METILQIITFPGLITARLFFEYKIVLFILFLSGVFFLSLRVGSGDKPGVFRFIFIFSALLFPALPGLTGFYSLESPVFFLCLTAGILGGWFYARSLSRGNGGLKTVDFGIGAIDEGKPPREGTVYILLLVSLFLMAFFIRTAGIDLYPGGYSFWELDRGFHAIKYDKGEKGLDDFLALFKRSLGQSSGSPFMMGLSLVFYKIFGFSLLTGRLVSVFLGLAGLIFMYLFLRSYLSVPTAFFLMIFPSLELSNVVFSRTGFNYISAFFFSTAILYLFQRTFQPGKNLTLALKGVLFGSVLYCSIYMYYPARVMVLAIILLILFNLISRKEFLKTYILPLALTGATLVGILFVHVNGDIFKLWPRYSGYLNPGTSASVEEFVDKSGFFLFRNARPAMEKIVFEQKAPDSDSPYAGGGLLSGPALVLIPFAIGFSLARINNRFIFSLGIILICSSLPALLSGVPNSRRLLIFNSFLLLLPGITLRTIYGEISSYFPGKKMGYSVFGILMVLFSFNLFIFWDVNKKMNQWPIRFMPFAESGFGDVTYSEYKLELAREVKTLLGTGDVFVYFSFTHDEPNFAPNGTFEQMLIEGYPQIRKGARLRWMNPFYSGFQVHPGRNYENSFFADYQELTRGILNSQKTVHVLFVKPLGDELGILSRLREGFPKSEIREIQGINEMENTYVVTVPFDSSRKNPGLQTGIQQEKPLGIKVSLPWTPEGKFSYVHPFSADRMSVQNPEKYLYSKFSQLFNEDGKALGPKDTWPITRIIENEGGYFILRGNYGMSGLLTVYDRNFRLLEDIPLHGYPFDGFLGSGGEIYITYLEHNAMGVYKAGTGLELWETGEISDLPIWNGVIDEEGDYILISSGKSAYILDSNRKLIRSFPVAVSWKVHESILRDRGGIVVQDGQIHLLNSYKNQIVSYNKSGSRLISKERDTLFPLPEGFQIAFLQENNGIIYLINRGEPRFFLSFAKGSGAPSGGF